MSSPTIRAGAWGIYTHAEAYITCPDTDLVAVCDADPQRAERRARRWNVPAWYTDPARLLAEQQPDVVSVCTPDATHHALIQAALSIPSVKGILAEKPLATTLEQAAELERLARARPTLLAVNYSRRHDDNHVRLREFLAGGGLGRVRLMRGLYTRGTAHNGTHWFDLARFLVGEVVRVRAVNRLGETGDDPSLDVQLEFRGGVVADLRACPAEEFTVFEMELLGSRGRVRLLDAGSVLEFYDVAEDRPFAGYRSLALTKRVDGGMGDLLRHAVEDLVHCLKMGGTPRCGGTDGVATLRIALAARESASTGRSVALEGDR